MPLDRTVARARAELDAGDAEMACKRLDGLVSSFPERLDVRDLLAQAERRMGNRVQAGRWSYLSDARDEAEVVAFERATPDPVMRMRALRWRAAPDAASTEVARTRLDELLRAAQAKSGRPELTFADLGEDLRWSPPSPTSWGDRLLLLAVCVVLGLFVLGVLNGVVTLARWLS